MGYCLYTMRSEMTSIRDRRHRLMARFTVIVGFIQLLVALSVLFLPVFAVCEAPGNDLICRRETYSQQGGSALGYVFLVLMIIVSVAAIFSGRDSNLGRAFVTRWVTALSSVLVSVVAGWGWGIVFAPGGVLMLLIAFMSG